MPTPHGKHLALSTAALALAVLVVAAWIGWPHVRFWWLFESLGKNAQGYPEYRHRQTGIVFIRVPGGTFTMGSPVEEERRMSDEDQHLVRLSEFLIGKFEVRQVEWAPVMGSYRMGKSPVQDLPFYTPGDDIPVHGLKRIDAEEFCARTGLKLPTEAQWEYACRAGTSTAYSGTGRLDDMGWYAENSGGRFHTVGEKSANGFGLYDVHGNVAEHCEDAWSPWFYSDVAAGGPDPVCRAGYISGMTIVRGGNFDSEMHECRAAARDRTRPIERNYLNGLRVAYYPLP